MRDHKFPISIALVVAGITGASPCLAADRSPIEGRGALCHSSGSIKLPPSASIRWARARTDISSSSPKGGWR